MTTPHGDVKANAAAYVLGSLDADDRAAFEAHLPACSECMAEVQSFRGVTDALARGAPERTPRPELRDRVLGTFSAVAAAEPSPAGVTKDYGARSWLPLAASILLTVAVGVYAARLQGRVNDLESRLEQAVLQASTAGRAVADARRVAAELQ